MHMIILYFLSFFSPKARLKLGKKIWDKLDAQLPEAHGVIEDDKPRMEQFSKLLNQIGKLKKKALQEWIEEQIYNLKYLAPDLTTWQEEEFERKWLQIYSEHLRILTKKTP